MIRSNFCLWRRAVVPENVVRVLEPKAVSHLLATRVSSELS